MKAERRKVRLNNKHPKEDASTFTQTRQRRLFFFFFFFFYLFLSFSLLFFSTYKSFSHSVPISIASLSFHVLSPLLCVSSHLFISPRATVPDPGTFVSLSLCYNFKRCRRSGHAVVPGASVTAPSQVYISQRVLDDTLSLSPILLLLISVVSSGGSKDSWATFTNYQPTPCYLCSLNSVLLTSTAGRKKIIITGEPVRMIVLIFFPLKKESESVSLRVKSPFGK